MHSHMFKPQGSHIVLTIELCYSRISILLDSRAHHDKKIECHLFWTIEINKYKGSTSEISHVPLKESQETRDPDSYPLHHVPL